MAFVKKIPRSRYPSGEVKVSFTGSKIANVYLGLKLLEKLGWDKNCRLYVYIDDEDKKKWMLEKADTEKDSYRLLSDNSVSKIASKLKFTFNAQEIKKYERKSRFVDFEIQDGKVIIKNK
jgi:hypothetical protein